MTTIFATDNALDVTREKVERIILVGKIFMFISRHSNAEVTVPSRGGTVSFS
jgi:muramidase (phage lysozyme)